LLLFGFMELYIIRHGQTDFNLRRIIQGRSVDSDLNQHGRIQAHLFAVAYGEVVFDKIYTSSQQRSIQTVSHFINKGIDHEIHPDIDEISWGVSEGIEGSKISIEKYMEVRDAWEKGVYSRRLEGGESLQELANRVTRFVHHIEAQKPNCALICSHGRTLRAMMAILLREPLHKLQQYDHGNLHLFHLVQKHDLPGYEVLLANNRDHLR